MNGFHLRFSLVASVKVSRELLMQTCWWPLSDHWSVQPTSPHLSGFVFYGCLESLTELSALCTANIIKWDIDVLLNFISWFGSFSFEHISSTASVDIFVSLVSTKWYDLNFGPSSWRYNLAHWSITNFPKCPLLSLCNIQYCILERTDCVISAPHCICTLFLVLFCFVVF